MILTPIIPNLSQIPEVFHPLLDGCPVFDSSCSKTAQVLFLDREGGLFLKSAAPGTLKLEAEMDAYYHSLGLGPEVLAYQSGHRDWLLTRKVPGQDCTHQQYLADPKRLVEVTALMLRDLHSRHSTGCPVPNHTEQYLHHARENYLSGNYDISLFPDNWGYGSAEEAWAVLESQGHLLKADTLLHGDYCLPNIMLNNWQPSGFIDVGGGGVGDKHLDLHWGIWSLGFNLKTDAYTDRFLDAYGREAVEPEMLRLIAACEVFG